MPKAPENASSSARATIRSLVVSISGSAGSTGSTCGNSTAVLTSAGVGKSGRATFSGTEVEGKGTAFSSSLGNCTETGAGVGFGAGEDGAISAADACPLAKEGIGSAWPATSSDASSSSTTLTRVSV